MCLLLLQADYMIDFEISIYTKSNNVLQSASCMIFIVLLSYRYCIVLFTVYLALAVFFIIIIIIITNTCFVFLFLLLTLRASL